MNNCIHCEELSTDTLSICIKCTELLLGALADLSRLQSRITELESQFIHKVAKNDISAPIIPYSTNIEKILQECKEATKRMLDIGKRVQNYKKTDIISEEK